MRGLGCERGEEARIVNASAIVPLYVRYGVLAEQLIEQGQYYESFEWARSPFLRIGGAGLVAYQACRFTFSGDGILPSEARELIRQYDRVRPWSQASLAAVLTFGIQYPSEQLIRPVLGLDAWAAFPFGEYFVYLHHVRVAHGTRGVVLPRRTLMLHRREVRLSEAAQFLAIRRE